VTAWLLILYTLRIFQILIFVRIVMSFFVNPLSRNPLVEMVQTTTDPILNPIRRVMPDTGMFDLSPMVAIILLQVLEQVVISVARMG
jgi:YggT family protein